MLTAECTFAWGIIIYNKILSWSYIGPDGIYFTMLDNVI